MAKAKEQEQEARVVAGPDGEQLADVEHGPTVEVAPVEVAEVDVLIERPDLGPGAHTLIVAGQPIPAELARLPRIPREQGPGGDG